jgi:hypothetical protein
MAEKKVYWFTPSYTLKKCCTTYVNYDFELTEREFGEKSLSYRLKTNFMIAILESDFILDI